MVTNIPSHTDFLESGTDLLNLAWDIFVQLQAKVDDARFDVWDKDGSALDEYWESAQRLLSTGLVLVQRGIEFFLKGRIVAVSPFLLIAGNASEWPRKCDKENIPFANFKTIDAQDLIRVHNTVVEPRLGESFTTHYENLRRLRNTIMHTVDKQTRVTAKDLVVAVLETSHQLIGPNEWLHTRRQYLEREPRAIAYTDDHVNDDMLYEAVLTIDLLTLSEAKHFFGFNKRQRRYVCPTCEQACENYEELPNFAQLKPNKPNSTNIYCLLCGENRTVSRQNCRYDDCKGNVIDTEINTCLTCYREQ